MAKINPFDELGRIIAAGGEQEAMEFAGSVGGGQPLLIFIRGRHPRLSENEVVILAELAEQGAAAGDAIERTPSDQVINLDAVPVNPILYGDEPDGRRIRVSVTATTATNTHGTEATIAVNLDFPTMPTPEEIREEILKTIEMITRDYPERFGQDEMEDLEQIEITVNSAQRRY